jgi:hypothetical protein
MQGRRCQRFLTAYGPLQQGGKGWFGVFGVFGVFGHVVAPFGQGVFGLGVAGRQGAPATNKRLNDGMNRLLAV